MRENGCRIAQGFFFDHALSIEEFEERLLRGVYEMDDCPLRGVYEMED